MSFMNPIALWGLLAISIPIMIHLWNGKRGKTIAWAAMDFLTLEENRVSKGLKLENLLVLFLRVLMIVLLVLVGAKVFWDQDQFSSEQKVAHLIFGEKSLSEEFRFELQQAFDRQELVLVSGDMTKPIENLELLFSQEFTSAENLQTALDQLPEDLDSLILYLPNSNSTLQTDFYRSFVQPTLRVSEQKPNRKKAISILTNTNSFQVSEAGVLKPVDIADSPTFDFSVSPMLYISQNSVEEKEVIAAALRSITEVYGLEFVETSILDSATLIFSNQKFPNPDPKKLYVISNLISYSNFENQLIFSDVFSYETSERVRSGQLPELILENQLEFMGLERNPSPLDTGMLIDRFLIEEVESKSKKANLNEWLLMLLLGLVILERLLAFKQKV